MNKLQLYLLIIGLSLFVISTILFIGTILNLVYIPYEQAMLIPIGYYTSSAILFSSSIVGFWSLGHKERSV